MARGIEGNEVASARPSSQKKAAPPSSTKTQKTLLGFFQRKAGPAPSAASDADATPSSPLPTVQTARKAAPVLTPAPSSSVKGSPSPTRPAFSFDSDDAVKDKENGLPSPATSSPIADAAKGEDNSSARRKIRRKVNYAESDAEEDDEDVFRPLSGNGSNARASKRRKVVDDDDDSGDEFRMDGASEALDDEDEDMDDFVVPDESEDDLPVSKKRKRPSTTSKQKETLRSSPPATLREENTEDMEIPETSTAQQWVYDSENPLSTKPRAARPSEAGQSNKKQKAHMTEPEKRYPWLANVLDADRNPPDHPDYDPRTIYIPPLAWTRFSPFEKQYWEIKQKFWNTIVFFKKGKFYELYEHDATIGHQLFDLKLTDRVNMRMVGVPEASLDQWANQFVAKGYKIARVDQMESALAKEMRERGDEKKKPQKEDKVIRRELASVLTAGTLVDGGMLQGDMATFCVAIKEVEIDGKPVFGIAFVDTATAQFQLCEIKDDADFTRFETFVAQTRPGELLLEKSCLSIRALRILKSNTSPTTIWNWLKPVKEFWPGDITVREVEASAYFTPTDAEIEADEKWPAALAQAKDKDAVMSAFGALLQYLRTLKLDRELVSLGNFAWYDPIRKATSLVLDGQSLINLEIFANTYDGGSDGTLFAMLNRCVTPFGKRMLRQWVCHPLCDAARINARLDAVDALNADHTVTDRFTASLTKLPDLERLISRIHAGRIRAQDFVKVLEGFEQIEYTMGLLRSFGEGEGLIGQLISSMPDLAEPLDHWKNAFDRELAKKEGYLVPQSGVEEDYDASAESIANCEKALQDLLRDARKLLGSSAICFRDNGKEIYQLEVPDKVKGIPKNWDQMSATAKVKRYYSPELRKLVRDLQEARETHAQIVKGVSGRFFVRFDVDYQKWLDTVRIVAQLDCLISLATASSSLGSPSCRPVFADGERSIVNFEELRHPTMLTTVTDFIPNDINLGGDSANLNLLTGANAAGKSTVLRMTCIAVILAQLGCYVPCKAAILTPVDRIMSRLGAHDNILQQQSTFYVELAETKKILTEATPRSLVILDELGRGTSSVDGLAVAEAVLHHIAGTVGCTGFFATHYHALAQEFALHPEVKPMRMAIDVDEEARRVTFLYRLEQGVALGSFGMHCASMCGIPSQVVDRAEAAAQEWEHTARVGEKIEAGKAVGRLGLGWCSDVAWILRDGSEATLEDGDAITERALEVLAKAISAL